MKFLWYFILFFLTSNDVFSAERSCFHFLDLFSKASKESFELIEAKKVQDLVLKEWAVGKIAYRYFYSEDHMATLFESMPKALQEIMIKADRLPEEERTKLYSQLYINSEKQLLWNELILYLPKNKSGWTKFKIDPIKKVEVEKEIQEAMLMGRANYAYTHKYYAPIKVDYQKKILIIGHISYPIEKKIFSNQWITYIPKVKLVRPAWNPLEPGKSASVLSHGDRINIYTNVSVGLNGKFYLTDGNHRFAFLEKREIVPVLINFDRTANLREFISHLGGIEISEKEILDLYEGRKLPFDFLGSTFRDELVVDDKDLIK
jgi:hypothetical protein